MGVLGRRSFISTISVITSFIPYAPKTGAQRSNSSPPPLPNPDENPYVWGMVDAAIHRPYSLQPGTMARHAKYVPKETISTAELEAVLLAADAGSYSPSDVPESSHPLYNMNRSHE